MHGQKNVFAEVKAWLQLCSINLSQHYQCFQRTNSHRPGIGNLLPNKVLLTELEEERRKEGINGNKYTQPPVQFLDNIQKKRPQACMSGRN